MLGTGWQRLPDELRADGFRRSSGPSRRAGVGAPTLHRASYEEAGDMGCLGVEYKRGSTGGSSSSISGPIASGSATYSNSPLPSIEGPLAQRPSWLSVPSEKFWNL